MESVLFATDALGLTYGEWAQIVAAVFAVLAALAIPATAYWRRPKLSLTEEGSASHSRVEAGDLPYLRLFVSNARRKRAAHRSRVIIEGCRRLNETTWTSFSHPSLGWPSAGIEPSAEPAVTIHSGSGRPIGLGRLIRVKRAPDGTLERQERYSQGLSTEVSSQAPIATFGADDPDASWHLMLEIHGFHIADDRDKLGPGEWVVRLLVAADDGDAQRYDVHVAWSGDAPTSRGILDEALNRLHVEKVRG